MKKKNAQYADFNQARIKKRAKALQEAGQFRPEETNKQGIRARRGFKPTYGDLKNVKEVQNAEVIDQAGKYLTNWLNLLPNRQTTQDQCVLSSKAQG